jgi:mRNA interferase YafQ
LAFATTAQFDVDLKRQVKRSQSVDELHAIIESLRARRALDSKRRHRPCGGEWRGWRDCHVEPDSVLIYRKDDATLEIGRAGSQSYLFV